MGKAGAGFLAGAALRVRCRLTGRKRREKTARTDWSWRALRAGPLPRLMGCVQNAPQMAVGQPVQVAQGEKVRAVAVALPDFVVAPAFP